MLTSDDRTRAREHEAVFRNVLRDLRDNRAQRPGGFYVPENLETEADIEAILEKYVHEYSYRRFTITEFVMDGNIAIITFQDIAFMSGGGASLKYEVKGDAVEYVEAIYVMMS